MYTLATFCGTIYRSESPIIVECLNPRNSKEVVNKKEKCGVGFVYYYEGCGKT